MAMVVAACVSLCQRSKKMTYGWEPPLYFVICIAQGLTLLMFSSDACHDNALVKSQDELLGSAITFPSDCSMGTGAKLTISSAVFFFVSAVLASVAYKAERQEMEEEESEGLREPLNL
mmetsp:Transcript_23394/g.36756  ORF Transcript_23394/g.36756 Transcript_23394/m.36756 type:complete len:118 (+) Transcript_23394:390-743(+)